MSSAQLFKSLGLCLFLLVHTACSITAVHPSLIDADLPKQPPVRDFVANTDFNGNYRISPDGTKLSWNGVSGVRSAILWLETEELTQKNIEEKKAAANYQRFNKYAPGAQWAADSRYLLYQADPTGHENHHIWAIDTNLDNPVPVNLTPYDGVKAFISHIPRALTSEIFISHNRRDREVFDLYSINLETGEEKMLFQNNDNSSNFLLDDDGKLLAKIQQTEKYRHFQVPDNAGWKTLLTADLFDALYPVGLDSSGKNTFFISNIDRDRQSLQKLNLSTGETTHIYEHESTDIGWARRSRKDNRLLMAYAEPDYPEIKFFDPDLEKTLRHFTEQSHKGLNLKSIDNHDRFATLTVWDHSGSEFLLMDLRSGDQLQLGVSAEKQYSNLWSEPEAVSIVARDGLELKAYLTLPNISDKRNLPTVLLVHGGPWGRDWWGHNRMVQFLANRGYAVLQINYRGSRGYGRAYMEAAIGEFSGKMHDDLIDGINWAIDKGISDHDKIAIVGGSYGGYATLVGMTMTPDRFACGIDLVGVSDLVSLLEDAPPYWKKWMHLWHRYVGDPSNSDQRLDMDKRSPLNYAKQMEGSLLILHGENDPRVKLDQSDRMVEALQKENKNVEYVVIKNEGHGFKHWKNQLLFYREMEDFLANCLGGRSAGFDYYQLGSWLF